jgi:hypothetical protein
MAQKLNNALGDHFDEDCRNGPNVHGAGVLTSAQENLWGTIPERHNLVRVHAHGYTESASKTEIGNLEGTVAINQQILRLEVAVDDTVGVAECHTTAKLEHVALQYRSKGMKSIRSLRVPRGRLSCGVKLFATTPTLTNMGSMTATLSMYFFKSWSRNSNTRWRLLSTWITSINLQDRKREL